MSEEKKVGIGHNQNQITDKLLDSLTSLSHALGMIDASKKSFSESCKGRAWMNPNIKLDAFEKVEAFQNAEDWLDSTEGKIKVAIHKLKTSLLDNGVSFEEKTSGNGLGRKFSEKK